MLKSAWVWYNEKAVVRGSIVAIMLSEAIRVMGGRGCRRAEKNSKRLGIQNVGATFPRAWYKYLSETKVWLRQAARACILYR